MNKPIWKPVPGFETFYEVSSDGKVRRIAPFTRGRGCKDEMPRVLKPENRDGYLRVTMYGEPGTRRKLISIHTLVAAAFIGPIPRGLEINHLDRNRANNSVENLEYVTRLGNSNHRHSFDDAHINMPRGEAHHNSKLNEAKVKEIRIHLAADQSMESIGSLYGITGATVAQIRDRKTWKHVGR